MVGSIIGAFIGSIIFLLIIYIYQYWVDSTYYYRNKHNENRKTIKLKYFHPLFLRYKKSDKREMFIGAFVQQLLCMIFAVAMVALMIMSFLLKNDWIMLIGLGSVFIYSVVFFIIIDGVFARKNKRMSGQ